MGGDAAPAAPAEDAVTPGRPVRCARRILRFTFTVAPVPIPTPFPDVPVHIEKAPLVGLLRANRLCPPAVLAVPGVFTQV